MKRKTLRKPSAHKPVVGETVTNEPVGRRQPFIALRREQFHFWVDVTTMLASIAAVVTLVLLLKDRPNQENIAAWTLLQSSLPSGKRPEFNQGQGFAMETLARHGISLHSIAASGVVVTSADLHDSNFDGAQLGNSQFVSSNLEGANFTASVLQDARIDQCRKCQNINFTGANLLNARISEADLSGANFDRADISGVYFYDVTLDRHDLETACFREWNPPKFSRRTPKTADQWYIPDDLNMPMAPQGELCMQQWGKAWEASGNNAAPSPAK